MVERQVAVTERMRKEIRDRMAELTPEYKWYIIARSERESVEWAYIRIDSRDNQAEIFSDDGISSQMYQICRGRQLIAERTIKWLEENNLWIGARITLPEEEQTDEPD